MVRGRDERKKPLGRSASSGARTILRTFLSEASFWTPDLLIPETPAWIEHAPFAFWLMQALRPRLFVELGTHSGFSYFAFCSAVQRLRLGTRCYAVDTWKGDEQAGFYGEEVFQKTSAENDARYSAFSTLVRSTFDAASSHFDDGSIDLLHIDGRHFYDDVKHDYRTWRPKLSEHAIVLFHDTSVRERDFGVSRLWDELCRDHPHFEFLHGHGLGVLGIGTRLPADLTRLFAAARDDEKATVIREAYSRLGGSFRLEVAVQRQAAEAHITREVTGTQIAILQSELQAVVRLEAELQDERDRKQVLTAELRDRNQVLTAELRAKFAHEKQLASEVADTLRHLKETEDKVRARAAELAGMRASTSWRITWPLRWLGAKLRRLGLHSHGPRLASWSQLRLGLRSYRRRRQDIRLIESSDLFDDAWYLARNPDARAVQMTAAEHYLRHGAPEERDASPHFDGNWYLEQYGDVKQARVNPLAHYLRHGRHEGRQLKRLGLESGAFDYFKDPKPELAPLRIALGCSTRGNFFMGEIGLMLEAELREIGMQTMRFDETSADAAMDCDIILVIAPHEYFALDGGKAWDLLSKHEGLVLVNTEQPQTPWFAQAKNFFRRNRIIFDMNYASATALRAAGYPAYFLPLGFSRTFEQRYANVVLERTGPLISLPTSTLQARPERYAARPIDILFVGTMSPKRSSYFARNAKFFSQFETFFYLPDCVSPFREGEQRTLDFSSLQGLARRSKIVLNVHRDEAPYLEWQRIANVGIIQRALVISETSQSGAMLVPNLHYVDAPLYALTELCEHYMAHPDLAESTAGLAYVDFSRRCRLEDVLRALLPALAAPINAVR